MEKNGFIEVIPSTVDKRFKQVVLTTSGKEKVPILLQCKTDIEQYFLKGISCEEFEVVHKVITQLKQNMNEYKGDKNA